ncbi:sensor histidine kinase [Terriglobus sp. TAA 43]|uniref:sensor histidine kinase n=1 Tax=Terriglobus sp. TAA 43 TaxID=278961 RepID=UPI001E5F1322|nr:sensor histidine kinase [Terriglobus sp. TAA 43]
MRATRQVASQLLPACLVAVLLSMLAAAQDLRYLRHGSWSTENGLPQNSVHQILQTKDGFLWIATEDGIARFDGVAFKTFKHDNEPTFASNDACCLAEEPSGDLWVGTNDGLLRLRRGVFQRFSEKDGLPSAEILGLQVNASGDLLVQTTSGIAAQSGERFLPRVHKISDDAGTVSPVVRGLGEEVWAMSGTGVKVTKPTATREWTISTGLPGTRVVSLFVDRQGNAWVGTNDGLAVIRHGGDHTESIAALRGNSVLQTYQDREGNYWTGTESTGLHLLHAEVFREAAGLADQTLTSIVQGSDGDIWVGTRNDGLRRIRDGRVENPVRADALTSRFILALAPGRYGDVWAGTPDGLNHIDSTGKVQRFTSADMLPDDYIRALTAGSDGAIWVGTRKGLIRLKGTNAKVFTSADGLGADLIGSLLSASSGDLWVGTSGGLSKLTSDGRLVTYTTKDGLRSPLVSALAESPAGTVWAGTTDGTISRVKDNHISTVRSSSLLVGKISALLADRAGFMWIRGEHSLLRVAVADLNSCIDKGERCVLPLQRYTKADGLPDSEIVAGGSPLLWQMQDGEVWSATQKGAAIASGQPIPVTQSFPVVIDRMLVDGTEQSLQRGPLTLGPGDSRVDIEYAGLSLASALRVEYRYRLDGFDRDWTVAGTRRTATYTNLPPRMYTFYVEARASDGTWLQPPAALAFRVTPPAYRRWWFILSAFLLATAAAVALYRLRLRRLRREFEVVLGERNRIAREIHDTLAQDFVGIALQLDLASQFLAGGEAESAQRQVQSTRKLVMEGLAEARRSIWDLRAISSKDSLPTRLAALVDRYSGPSLAIKLQVGGAYRQLPARVEEEVLRIAQEALSNIQRHSGVETAHVQLHFGTNILMMTVRDQGCGFSVDEQQAFLQGHFGVSGMRERAAAIGAKLLIESEVGQGTTVTLRANIAGEEGRQS